MRYEGAGGSFGTLTLKCGFGAESVNCGGGKWATRAAIGVRADDSNCCICIGTETAAAADCAASIAEMFELLALSAAIAFGGPIGSGECSPFACDRDTEGAAADEEAEAEAAHSSAFVFFGGRPTRGRDDCSPFAALCAAADCSLFRL